MRGVLKGLPHEGGKLPLRFLEAVLNGLSCDATAQPGGGSCREEKGRNRGGKKGAS